MKNISQAAEFKPQVIIIGAGASGLMCAIEAGKRGKRVLVIDHQKEPGAKILISGGGKCNFTNFFLDAENYISENPHFCKSAISRYTQWDFIALLESHRIKYEQRKDGQLFCKKSSKDILDMLLKECRNNNVNFLLNTKIDEIFKKKDFFQLNSGSEKLLCKSLVIATGGPSLPETGATGFGYKVADDFDINIIPYQPALVPLTMQPEDKKIFSDLSGLTVEAEITCGKKAFRDNLLFTHKGLSGPGILKISLWFKPGDTIDIDLLPDTDIEEIILKEKNSGSRKKIKNLISEYLPKSLVETVIDKNLQNRFIADITKKETENLKSQLQNLKITPGGTEGLKTAEAVKGGVDCHEISSKTMESLKVKSLYFTGEVLDVTGMLGGYNLQWAWSSGWCAGQNV